MSTDGREEHLTHEERALMILLIFKPPRDKIAALRAWALQCLAPRTSEVRERARELAVLQRRES
jgi:hypothetical protein